MIGLFSLFVAGRTWELCLFEVMTSTNPPPMQGHLLAPLVDLNSISESLLRSIETSSSSHRTHLRPPLTEHVDCDFRIATTLDEARVHQAKQREICNLATEVLGLNTHLREIITVLVQGRNTLQDMIEEGEAILHASTDTASKSA